MARAKVFRSGATQFVLLPNQFRLNGEEVEIYRRGDEIVLREKGGAMTRAFELWANFPAELDVRPRQRDLPQRRKHLQARATRAKAICPPNVQLKYYFRFDFAAALSSITACAAARREIGTRNGDALT